MISRPTLSCCHWWEFVYTECHHENDATSYLPHFLDNLVGLCHDLDGQMVDGRQQQIFIRLKQISEQVIVAPPLCKRRVNVWFAGFRLILNVKKNHNFVILNIGKIIITTQNSEIKRNVKYPKPT